MGYETSTRRSGMFDRYRRPRMSFAGQTHEHVAGLEVERISFRGNREGQHRAISFIFSLTCRKMDVIAERVPFAHHRKESVAAKRFLE